MALLSAPPTRLSRWVFTLPLWLYRDKLGWLLGHHLARVTHAGRRTGRIRQTVIEVVRYDPGTREIVFAAGWGGRTDWYRDILASPAREIPSGLTAYRPTQRMLTVEETCAEIREYARRHPWLAHYALPRLLGIAYDAPEAELCTIVEATLRGVAFRPRA